MSQFPPSDYLQSSLWDRLVDDRESASGSSRHNVMLEQSMISRRERLRRVEAVRREIERDILFLLTTRQRHAPSNKKNAAGTAFPAIDSSVLNYGLPDLTGNTTSGIDAGAIARVIKHKLEAFEPRLHRGSIETRCWFTEMPDELVVGIAGRFGPPEDSHPLTLEVTIRLSSGDIVASLARA